jgi:serine/threonine protein kinase
MCPSVVRSKETGIEADLWALGVVIYQLIMGFSPFSNPSPYLTFLRIKRGLVRLPAFAPAEIKVSKQWTRRKWIGCSSFVN